MNSFENLLDQILVRKVAFLIAFFIVFTLTYGVLFAVDFLPETPTTDSDSLDDISVVESVEITEEENTMSYPNSADSNLADGEALSSIDTNPAVNMMATSDNLPILLKIEALNREVKILNPTTRTIAGLDNALLSGVVRHPDSAVLGQEGNMFILGHSSYLPKVINKNFQALNGIQNLKWGDIITLQSSDTLYTYQVKKVYLAKAANLTVPIAGVGKHLTLATCNSFGSKDDRYIVDADLISTKTL